MSTYPLKTTWDVYKIHFLKSKEYDWPNRRLQTEWPGTFIVYQWSQGALLCCATVVTSHTGLLSIWSVASLSLGCIHHILNTQKKLV